MMHKALIAAGLFAVVVITAGWLMLPRAATPSSTSALSSSEEPSAASASSTQQSSVITMAQVEAHADESSCWAAINGKVYDLTQWIHQHPGGPEHILALCGTDGSAAFNAQHGGESQPAQELATFYIGDLAQ